MYSQTNNTIALYDILANIYDKSGTNTAINLAITNLNIS